MKHIDDVRLLVQRYINLNVRNMESIWLRVLLIPIFRNGCSWYALTIDNTDVMWNQIPKLTSAARDAAVGTIDCSVPQIGCPDEDDFNRYTDNSC